MSGEKTPKKYKDLPQGFPVRGKRSTSDFGVSGRSPDQVLGDRLRASGGHKTFPVRRLRSVFLHTANGGVSKGFPFGAIDV